MKTSYVFVKKIFKRILNPLLNKLSNKLVINQTDSILAPFQFRSFLKDYEPQTWKYVMNQVKKGDIVADVGAFIGIYTIAFAKRVGPTGKVFSFEPDQNNLKLLKKMLKLNSTISSRVELINLAVADKDGAIYFEDGMQSESHILQNPKDTKPKIPCTSLDKFFMNQTLDILKIDVEGYELEVLKGAVNILLSPSRPRCIFVEVHPCFWDSNPENKSQELLNILKMYNLRFFDETDPLTRMPNFWGWIVATK